LERKRVVGLGPEPDHLLRLQRQRDLCCGFLATVAVTAGTTTIAALLTTAITVASGCSTVATTAAITTATIRGRGPCAP
jgi:hypothetical protein